VRAEEHENGTITRAYEATIRSRPAPSCQRTKLRASSRGFPRKSFPRKTRVKLRIKAWTVHKYT